MKNLEIKELNRDTIVISNISRFMRKLCRVNKVKDFSEKGIKYIHISLSVQDMENIKFLLDNGYYFKANTGNEYIF